MLKVYQIVLTDLEITIANQGGSTPKLKAFFDRTFESTFDPKNFEHYTHVANVDVDGFEQAFRVMNLWEDDENFDRVKIVTESGRCSSMSVGDIIADHDGKLYRCASFGFTPLNNYNS